MGFVEFRAASERLAGVLQTAAALAFSLAKAQPLPRVYFLVVIIIRILES
jgi:hypothetical protein